MLMSALRLANNIVPKIPSKEEITNMVMDAMLDRVTKSIRNNPEKFADAVATLIEAVTEGEDK